MSGTSRDSWPSLLRFCALALCVIRHSVCARNDKEVRLYGCHNMNQIYRYAYLVSRSRSRSRSASHLTPALPRTAPRRQLCTARPPKTSGNTWCTVRFAPVRRAHDAPCLHQSWPSDAKRASVTPRTSRSVPLDAHLTTDRGLEKLLPLREIQVGAGHEPRELCERGLVRHVESGQDADGEQRRAQRVEGVDVGNVACCVHTKGDRRKEPG